MYRTIKAELKVIVRRPIYGASSASTASRLESVAATASRVARRRRDAVVTRTRAQVCPAPKPINEFAEALAAPRADEGEEGANKAVDACEPVRNQTAERLKLDCHTGSPAEAQENDRSY